MNDDLSAKVIAREASKAGLRGKINAKCCVEGCDSPISKKPYCNAHYLRLKRYGRLHAVRRAKGDGTIKNNGYIAIQNGSLKYQHRALVESIIGKALPDGAEIHHVDGDASNNTPTNLVVCPSRSYHALLHKRTRAYESCGNADWIKCCYCGEYDSPENMKHYEKSGSRHSECATRYTKERRAR